MSKIARNFEQSVSSFSPVTQTDGAELDNDVEKQLVAWISNEIRGELLGTSAHEAEHMGPEAGYWGEYKKSRERGQGPNFGNVQEAPGPAFESKMKSRFHRDVKMPFAQ